MLIPPHSEIFLNICFIFILHLIQGRTYNVYSVWLCNLYWFYQFVEINWIELNCLELNIYRVPIYTPGWTRIAAMWIQCFAEGQTCQALTGIEPATLWSRVKGSIQYTTTPPHAKWWWSHHFYRSASLSIFVFCVAVVIISIISFSNSPPKSIMTSFPGQLVVTIATGSHFANAANRVAAWMSHKKKSMVKAYMLHMETHTRCAYTLWWYYNNK